MDVVVFFLGFGGRREADWGTLRLRRGFLRSLLRLLVGLRLLSLFRLLRLLRLGQWRSVRDIFVGVDVGSRGLRVVASGFVVFADCRLREIFVSRGWHAATRGRFSSTGWGFEVACRRFRTANWRFRAACRSLRADDARSCVARRRGRRAEPRDDLPLTERNLRFGVCDFGGGSDVAGARGGERSGFGNARGLQLLGGDADRGSCDRLCADERLAGDGGDGGGVIRVGVIDAIDGYVAVDGDVANDDDRVVDVGDLRDVDDARSW